MEWLADPNAWLGLLTLAILEIVLGIDNIIFISILAGRLPENTQARARRLGIGIALVSRIILLCSIGLVMKLDKPFFTWDAIHLELSGRSLILLIGGLFLIGKATFEIHHKLEGEEEAKAGATAATMQGVLVQIFLVDMVFSIDSVVTAVGMVEHIPIMIAAVLIASAFMLWFSGPVSSFVHKHPTVKMLALSFLVLIGVNLVAEGFGHHIPKGYTYFAMAFSTLVEMLNIKLKKTAAAPVHLHGVPEAPTKAG